MEKFTSCPHKFRKTQLIEKMSTSLNIDIKSTVCICGFHIHGYGGPVVLCHFIKGIQTFLDFDVCKGS